MVWLQSNHHQILTWDGNRYLNGGSWEWSSKRIKNLQQIENCYLNLKSTLIYQQHSWVNRLEGKFRLGLSWPYMTFCSGYGLSRKSPTGLSIHEWTHFLLLLLYSDNWHQLLSEYPNCDCMLLFGQRSSIWLLWFFSIERCLAGGRQPGRPPVELILASSSDTSETSRNNVWTALVFSHKKG